mmetsp:Transcript_4363/g.10792  ORF Transcript_4363/g.10792 Transcript_4363/m.10792 type:complete len:249 (-) Transcript_4363:207-953(-)
MWRRLSMMYSPLVLMQMWRRLLPRTRDQEGYPKEREKHEVGHHGRDGAKGPASVLRDETVENERAQKIADQEALLNVGRDVGAKTHHTGDDEQRSPPVEHPAGVFTHVTDAQRGEKLIGHGRNEESGGKVHPSLELPDSLSVSIPNLESTRLGRHAWRVGVHKPIGANCGEKPDEKEARADALQCPRAKVYNLDPRVEHTQVGEVTQKKSFDATTTNARRQSNAADEDAHHTEETKDIGSERLRSKDG